MTATAEATTHELRKKAREYCKQNEHDSTWTASARRRDCEIYLATGELPAYAKQATTPQAEVPAASNDLAAAIAKAVEGYIKPQAQEAATVDENAVKQIVSDMLAEQKPQEQKITVTLPNEITKEIDQQHKLFPLLLTVISQRIPCWLAGPAGSGKTSAAAAAAKALDLPFYAESFCNQTPASKLLGYMDATGKYVSTDFRRAYENGGVYCLDEIDNANPNILAVLNSALANGHCSFADGQVEKHADFIPVAGANTFGSGGNRQYLRNQIDAATLDRFYFVEWGYDEAFEAALLGIDSKPEKIDLASGGIPASSNDWLDLVKDFRKAADKVSARMVISPRASIYGAKLASAGLGYDGLLTGLIFKGADKTMIEKLSSNAGRKVQVQ